MPKPPEQTMARLGELRSNPKPMRSDLHDVLDLVDFLLTKDERADAELLGIIAHDLTRLKNNLDATSHLLAAAVPVK